MNANTSRLHSTKLTIIVLLAGGGLALANKLLSGIPGILVIKLAGILIPILSRIDESMAHCSGESCRIMDMLVGILLFVVIPIYILTIIRLIDKGLKSGLHSSAITALVFLFGITIAILDAVLLGIPGTYFFGYISR